MSDSVPADLRYTKEHEWVRAGAADVAVGITAFAVEQLGDVTLVNLDVKVGDDLSAGKPFGTIESVKTLSDLYAPVAGKVVRINDAIANKPELVNQDCFGAAWMIAIAPSDPRAIDALMDAKAYAEYVKAQAH
ncbi:MAG TPA: glycine cleavage system protein GcvH [Polyangiaceae bacterium]|nr:glycine cleavage system protein GcvH [Polyangiaceae bacterium]